MEEIIVISGKGGTGKTSLMAAFSSLTENKVLCDADVDAADLHLIMNPKVIQQTDFQSGNTAVIDKDQCTECGLCREMCRFDAIIPGDDTYCVDPLACEGCDSCVHQCPEEAIHSEEQQAGLWFRSDTRFGPLFHAHLFAAQENSGKLVTMVKQQGRLLANEVFARLLPTAGSEVGA